MLHAVIMAGGSGTRFWPASRTLKPKQLLGLAGDRTMIQATVDRLQGLIPAERTLVITNRLLVPAVREQLPELPESVILGEPCKRDTAPCVGLAAMIVLRHDHEATMLVTPADHLIEPPACFHSAVLQANRIIEADPRKIVTFGIRPSYPAETFGYIERGEALGKDDAAGEAPAYRVHMFREKPSALVAQQYVDSGRFYWNSGIFVWKAQTILDALQEYEPEMYAQLETLARAMGTPAFEASLEKEFAAIRGKSIDYAVMERYPNVAVVEALFAWDDVGSWRSLNRIRGADADGNTVDGKHLGLRTHGCIVRGERDHLIVTVGLEDCIIVHTPTATLVARKQDEESVRQVVEMIRQHGWSEYL